MWLPRARWHDPPDISSGRGGDTQFADNRNYNMKVGPDTDWQTRGRLDNESVLIAEPDSRSLLRAPGRGGLAGRGPEAGAWARRAPAAQ